MNRGKKTKEKKREENRRERKRERKREEKEMTKVFQPKAEEMLFTLEVTSCC